MAEAVEQKTNNNTNKKPIEYNPRWKGYVYIGLASLINFSSIANIQVVAEGGFVQRGSTFASMSYGFVTFVLSILILIQDRSQKCIESFQSGLDRGGERQRTHEKRSFSKIDQLFCLTNCRMK